VTDAGKYNSGEKPMKTKIFGKVSLFCLIVTIFWLVLMVLDISQNGTIDTQEQAINSVKNRDWLFYLTYINAVIITILVTILFVGLYIYCKPSEPELSMIGLIFVPVYCMFNLFSYFSQITIVTKLLSYQNVANNDVIFNIFLGQMIQGRQGSAISVINNLAYAILGVSSIIFGVVLLKKRKFAKISGIFLILNAVACIIGIIGIVAGNKIIGMGSSAGGIFFIVALVFLCFMFFMENENETSKLKNPTTSSNSAY